MTAAQAATAWTGTSWNTASQWHSGLKIIGTIESNIRPFDPKLEVDSLDFQIVETDDTMRRSLFRRNSSAAETTVLTADCDSDDLELTVLDGFSDDFNAYCGLETM